MTVSVYSYTQVLISDDSNYTEPNQNAVLDLYSQSRGVIIPRIDPSNLQEPIAAGMVVFNTTTHCFQGWDGNQWQNMGTCANSTGFHAWFSENFNEYRGNGFSPTP